MTTYADFFTPDLFFVTCCTVDKEPVVSNEMVVRLLWSALHEVKQRHPFHLIGYLFLPEQIQLLLEPAGRTLLDQVVNGLVKHFQLEYQQLLGMPGELLLWETRYVAQRVLDVEAFATHLDTMHYQPVQQGYVERPEAWPYSSYTVWAERGLYAHEWGWTPPVPLPGLTFTHKFAAG